MGVCFRRSVPACMIAPMSRPSERSGLGSSTVSGSSRALAITRRSLGTVAALTASTALSPLVRLEYIGSSSSSCLRASVHRALSSASSSSESTFAIRSTFAGRLSASIRAISAAKSMSSKSVGSALYSDSSLRASSASSIVRLVSMDKLMSRRIGYRSRIASATHCSLRSSAPIACCTLAPSPAAFPGTVSRASTTPARDERPLGTTARPPGRYPRVWPTSTVSIMASCHRRDAGRPRYYGGRTMIILRFTAGWVLLAVALRVVSPS